jgi:hypothetical protein
MSRKPALKPNAGNREELLERRVAALEARMRAAPARTTQGHTTATTFVVSKTAHGLAVKDVVRHNGTDWTKSKADTAANAVVGGMVIAVLSPDVFVIATPGSYVAGLSSLTAGSVHYLDSSTAGAITTTAPAIAVPIIHADTTTSGVLLAALPGGGAGNASEYGYVYASAASSPFAGEWTRSQSLGRGQRTSSADVGSLDVAISTDGDAVRISDAEDGIAIYDRSVSNTTPLIKIALGNAALNATGRALEVREIDICDGGAPKKMLVLASVPY